MRIVSLVLLSVTCLGCNQVVTSMHESSASSSSQPTMVMTESTTKEMAATESSAPADVILVSFKVEGMSCPHGCYPSVREAIAKQKTVDGIELAPQKAADVIDNPIVTVKYHGQFDVKAAMAAIADAGFDKVEVVTN